MMRIDFMLRCSLILLVAALMLPCACSRSPSGSFAGTIEFRNKSSSDIRMTKVSGFERNPPVGNLKSGISATAHMRSMPLPTEISITWQYLEKVEKTEVLSLAGIDVHAGPMLVIEFTAQEQWTASMQPE